MTRCSYIPPEGQSVIAIAKERGGTTDGDIAALRDRFGCKAEAAFEMTAEEDSDREQFSCVDHVGHLCGDGYWLVQPVYVPSDVAITIVNTQGIARAGFGSPMILAPLPTTTPVVDLGANPTRELLAAHGCDAEGSAAYREARAAFDEHDVIVHDERRFVVLRCRAPRIDVPGDGTGTLALRATVTPDALAFLQAIGRRTIKVEAGPAFTADTARIAHLRMPIERNGVASDIEIEFRAIGLAVASPANRPTDGSTTCPAALGGSMHTYTPGAERCFCGRYAPPPYAVGDEVEWQPGPFGYDTSWQAGRVTSIVDDRPDDGIDKPFWIVRVDTAGERRFSGPAVAVCLRRAQPLPADVMAARRDLLRLPGIAVRVGPGRLVTAVHSGPSGLIGHAGEMVARVATAYPGVTIHFEWTET